MINLVDTEENLMNNCSIDESIGINLADKYFLVAIKTPPPLETPNRIRFLSHLKMS